MAWYDAEKGEADVDEDVGAAACDQEDSERRDWKDHMLADFKISERTGRADVLKMVIRTIMIAESILTVVSSSRLVLVEQEWLLELQKWCFMLRFGVSRVRALLVG